MYLASGSGNDEMSIEDQRMYGPVVIANIMVGGIQTEIPIGKLTFVLKPSYLGWLLDSKQTFGNYC